MDMKIIMAHFFEMIFLIFLIGKSSITALDENISAVHYSIVSAGIDGQINPSKRLVFESNEQKHITNFL